MDAVATQKFVRMSPRKLRVVARMVKTMQPETAVEVLPFMGKRAALPIQKVIKTAIANARVKGLALDQLSIAEIQIGEGPRLKRFRAGSRGRAKPYTHDMAHIRVVLTDAKKMKKSDAKKQKIQEVAAEVVEAKPAVVKRETKKTAVKPTARKRKETTK